jgi:alpha-mannosidase
MQNEKIHLLRIKRLLERQTALLYKERAEVRIEFSLTGEELHPIQIGEIWGTPWQTGRFELHFHVPLEFSGKQYGLFFDCDGEACVMSKGTPVQGLTPKVDWYHKAAKHFFPLNDRCRPGGRIFLDIEASANDLFGRGKEEYRLRECHLCCFDEFLFQRLMDIGVLLNLAEALPAGTVRRQRIIKGLDQVCDLWNSDTDGVQVILQELLSHSAHDSALTAFSVGHAHLDLAWLWPLRESHRKGGRTFANALRLLEQYPEYIFGASQAQLYQWIKDDYPALFEQVKVRVREGRWEIQGASWVEFDTNLISAESIIRQFLYGKRFFREEFGIEPDILWLPDCFGFSGNLPQLLKGCGVHHFMTQKLSWNETNTFPHHLFNWEGIDGTRLLAHQLPTNDYNFSNDPSAFLETEKRYAQSEVCDSFLNLYGIGDGGGGPTRNHIEYGLRQQNLEGVSKFKFSQGKDFFEHIKAIDRQTLPTVYGELYLEYHRGTYTTQARMKQDNRTSESLLSAAEFVSVLAGLQEYPPILRNAWEDTLLLQFHDIIPGSSIGMVYEDAQKISSNTHRNLKEYIANTLNNNDIGILQTEGSTYLAFNASGVEITDWRPLTQSIECTVPQTLDGVDLPWLEDDGIFWVKLTVPAWSCLPIRFVTPNNVKPLETQPGSLTLENDLLRVELTEFGSIASIYDKLNKREVLADASNLLLLCEDEPNNWGAWDINHFYRTTTPVKPHYAELVGSSSIILPGQFSRVVQDIFIGQSSLRQSVELREGEAYLRISHKVDWKESHKMLRVHFYPEVFSGEATYGIQDGVIKRSCKPKNAWEDARFEVPAQKFADLSQPDYGCALICGDKFGWRVSDNEMELNLLRSPADVDPNADIHNHEYCYTFYPHTGDYEHSDVFQVAERCASRLEVVTLAGNILIPDLIPFVLDSDQILLDTVKPAENGSGVILRLHECKGAQGTAELSFVHAYQHASLCDMLENPLSEIPAEQLANRKLELSFRPFEIKTLLLSF